MKSIHDQPHTAPAVVVRKLKAWRECKIENIIDQFPAFDDCQQRLGSGYTCEFHPTKAWGEFISDIKNPVNGACYCGGAGIPCSVCVERSQKQND
jgi:hypothetical protein